MIKKYVYGNPVETEAVVVQMPSEDGAPSHGGLSVAENFCYRFDMADSDIVYGLGEANRGINKRGFQYVSDCKDDPNHLEDTVSLYAAHNFIVVSGAETFGLFFDYPGIIRFDIGYTKYNRIEITGENADFYLYEITGENAYDIVKQFRGIIGRSYIPPKYAFGFGQSRWGYVTADDFRTVLSQFRENHVPLDMLYMDIDYMQDYKDFTINQERFPDFEGFVSEMKKEKIHLIPIIDAGVKIEDGYDVYEEGVEKGYFCKREDGSNFAAAVWPGMTHFPDMLNREARKWFGDKYEFLLSKGIDGFWNDMNEPSIFYSEEGMAELKEFLRDYVDGKAEGPHWMLMMKAGSLANSPKDYQRFYHNMDGKMVRHDKVHNLFGYNMTRAAGEAFERLSPDKRILMFSRSSYIGMHRYGGIWTGDNKSWWSHLLLSLKQMASLNMCGFLYSGSDLCGFGSNATEDLALRWLALGVFTPLMRNHAALGTREQEFYQFERTDDFRHVIGVRYRLLPYIYSEFMKAALNNDLYFKPLAFVYPADAHAREVEDQLMIGDEVMIAPVYTQNATGRYVYLPEEMKFIKFVPGDKIEETVLPQGHHYVDVALNEVPLFIRSNRCIPVADFAETVADIDESTIRMIGYTDASYDRYDDDGVTRV